MPKTSKQIKRDERIQLYIVRTQLRRVWPGLFVPVCTREDGGNKEPLICVVRTYYFPFWGLRKGIHDMLWVVNVVHEKNVRCRNKKYGT